MEFSGPLDHDVGLKPGRIAPEIQIGRQAGIEPALEQLRDRPCLEQRAAHMRTVGAGRFTEHVAETNYSRS